MCGCRPSAEQLFTRTWVVWSRGCVSDRRALTKLGSELRNLENSLTCNCLAYILTCRPRTSSPSSPSSAHWRSLWAVWRRSTWRTHTEEVWSGCPGRSSSFCWREGNLLDLWIPSGATCLPSLVCLAGFHKVSQTLDAHSPPWKDFFSTEPSQACYLDEHSQHGQTVRLVHGVAKVSVLGVVVHQVQLGREGLPVHRVFAASSVLSAPVGVKLGQLVDVVFQRPSGQTWSTHWSTSPPSHQSLYLSLQGSHQPSRRRRCCRPECSSRARTRTSAHPGSRPSRPQSQLSRCWWGTGGPLTERCRTLRRPLCASRKVLGSDRHLEIIKYIYNYRFLLRSPTLTSCSSIQTAKDCDNDNCRWVRLFYSLAEPIHVIGKFYVVTL